MSNSHVDLSSYEYKIEDLRRTNALKDRIIGSYEGK